MSLVVAGLLLLDVGVIASRRSRNRFIWEYGAFRCRFRACGRQSGVWPGLARRCRRRWSRTVWAGWDGDVLTVRRGPLLPRMISGRAQMCRAGVYSVPPGDAPGLGSHPIAVGLQLWDRSVVEIVAAGDEREALVGPYLAAAVNDLPRSLVRDTELDVQTRQPNDQDERRQ